MCPSNYHFKWHKNMDQKVFEGCNLAWLQKKGRLWDIWIQMAKHKRTFILFTFKRHIYKNPLNSKQTFGVQSWHTLILTTYSIFEFFFLFLFFSFSFSLSCIHIFFPFLFLCIYNTMLSWSKNKNTPFYLTNDLYLPFSPQLEQNIPYSNVPLFYGKGTNKHEGLAFNNLKTIRDLKCVKNELDFEKF